MENNIKIIKDYLSGACDRMFCEPKGYFKHKCLLPVAAYSQQLWDWGCWTSNVAVRQIMTDLGRQNELNEYERGNRKIFVDFQKEDGRIPIVVATADEYSLEHLSPNGNIHKPVMAQHIAFISKYSDGASWIKDDMQKVEKFLKYYDENYKHESGLYFFADDFAIGVDNDPSTWFRPNGSSASIYLNSLMYKEFLAMAYIYEMLGENGKVKEYENKAQTLKDAINENCWDEKDGMYYSCDINLNPMPEKDKLHSGCPRHYNTLIQRIGSWNSFMPLWAGIADEEKAKRMIFENLLDEKAFWGAFGVRSLSKYEKMYRIQESTNPSCWHGPVWGVSNYMVFKGLLNYGYQDLARELCDKTIEMFAKDIEENNAMHEYYDPETGKGVFNKDFLSWNMLVMNMIAWRENRPVISEI